MNSYRVSFLLNSEGHHFKCLQLQIDVHSDGPSQALVLAERLTDGERLNADCVEVTHLTSDHPKLEHSSSLPVAPCKHTWNRIS